MRRLLATVILLSAAAVPGQALKVIPQARPSAARHSVRQQGFEGTWLAEIVTPGNHVRVVLRIFGQDALLSDSATVEALQATSDGTRLQLDLSDPPATFEGELQPEGSQIVGKWTQDGDDCWLVFRRA
ncbi:MAG: hypothetical protein O3A53_17480 [Acidobacteria bacterium]|nr:hypothetical protein [Acidobacteriota bacterium]MDA1236580.1 hypothetical protein [Acidobacteriota bacterium]